MCVCMHILCTDFRECRIYCISLYVCVCVLECTELKINISEGVKFAQDICNGMTYLHTMETLITRFDLSPHHVFVSLIDVETLWYKSVNLDTLYYTKLFHCVLLLLHTPTFTLHIQVIVSLIKRLSGSF